LIIAKSVKTIGKNPGTGPSRSYGSNYWHATCDYANSCGYSWG